MDLQQQSLREEFSRAREKQMTLQRLVSKKISYKQVKVLLPSVIMAQVSGFLNGGKLLRSGIFFQSSFVVLIGNFSGRRIL